MAEDPSKPVIVQTNCGSDAEARGIARDAVEVGLAASANIHGPITSVYRWQGSIAESPEWVVYLKTTKAHVDDLQTLIAERHSYELPSILVLPIDGGEARYVEWILEQTR